MPTPITLEHFKDLTPVGQKKLATALKKHQRIKAEAPYLLYESYEGWQRDFFESTARTRVAHCGNRTGKTYACCADVTLQIYRAHPFRPEHNNKRRMRVRIVAPDEEHSLKSWVETFKLFLPAGDIIKDYIPGVSKSRRIELDPKRLGRPVSIDFMTHSMEVDQFESVELELIVFDEVPPRQIYNACLLRTLAGGGCILIAATPQTSTNDPGFFRELVEALGSKSIDEAEVFCGSMYDAAAAGVVEYTKEILDKMAKDLPEDEVQIRIYGKPVNIGGLVFKEFRDRFFTDEPPGHLFDPEILWPGDDNQAPGIPPKDWQIVAGLDPSVNGYTGMLWQAISPLNERYYFHEYYERDLIIKDHARNIMAEEARFGREIQWRVIDPAAHSQSQTQYGFERVIDQYAAENVLCFTEMGLRDEPARIMKVREALMFSGAEGNERPGIYIASNLVNLRRQLNHVSWESWRDPNAHNPKQKTQDRDNHLTDVIGLIEAMNPTFIKREADDGASAGMRWQEYGVA